MSNEPIEPPGAEPSSGHMQQTPNGSAAPDDAIVPWSTREGCTVCEHPRRAEIEARLSAKDSVSSLSRDFGIAYHLLRRHIEKQHAKGVSKRTHQEASESTVSRALRLAKTAERNLRRAMKSGEVRDANGAVRSACDALKLLGSADGSITPPNVTVITQLGVSLPAAKAAVELADKAANLTPAQVLSRAGECLAAALEAGDPHAIRIVGQLVRMLPSGAGDVVATG